MPMCVRVYVACLRTCIYFSVRTRKKKYVPAVGARVGEKRRERLKYRYNFATRSHRRRTLSRPAVPIAIPPPPSLNTAGVGDHANSRVPGIRSERRRRRSGRSGIPRQTMPVQRIAFIRHATLRVRAGLFFSFFSFSFFLFSFSSFSFYFSQVSMSRSRSRKGKQRWGNTSLRVWR